MQYFETTVMLNSNQVTIHNTHFSKYLHLAPKIIFNNMSIKGKKYSINHPQPKKKKSNKV